MPLDGAYFSAISLNEYKNRYYDIGQVDSLLVDIRRQAEDLTQENLDLHDQLEESTAALSEAQEKAESYRVKGIALSREIRSLRSRLEEAQSALEEAQSALEAARSAQAEAEAARAEAESARSNAESALAEAESRAAAAGTPDAPAAAAPVVAAPALQDDTDRLRKLENIVASLQETHTATVARLNAQWQSFLADWNAASAPSDLAHKIGCIVSAMNEIEAEELSEEEKEELSEEGPSEAQ